MSKETLQMGTASNTSSQDCKQTGQMDPNTLYGVTICAKMAAENCRCSQGMLWLCFEDSLSSGFRLRQNRRLLE